MPDTRDTIAPPDAAERRKARPVVAYPVERLPPFDAAFYAQARAGMSRIGAVPVLHR